MKRKKKNSIQTSRNNLLTKFFTVCFVFFCAAVFLCGVVTARENTDLRYLGKSVDTVYREDVELFVEEVKNMLFLLY